MASNEASGWIRPLLWVMLGVVLLLLQHYEYQDLTLGYPGVLLASLWALASCAMVRTARCLYNVILIPVFIDPKNDLGAAVIASVLVIASLIAYRDTHKGHSLLLLLAAPLGVKLGQSIYPTLGASIMAGLIALRNPLAVSGCPFRLERGVAYMGSVLAIASLLLAALLGWSIASPLWVLAFLLQVSGLLAPRPVREPAQTAKALTSYT